MNARKLHPTGLVPDALAAHVLDFMTEQRLGLRGLAAAADVVAAHCRMNEWVVSTVKNSGLNEEGWFKLLEHVEQTEERAVRAMQAYATNHNIDELCAEFAEVTAKLNDRTLQSA